MINHSQVIIQFLKSIWSWRGLKNINSKNQKVQLKAVQSPRQNYLFFLKQSELHFQKVNKIVNQRKKQMLKEEKVKRAIVWKLPRQGKRYKQNPASVWIAKSWVKCLNHENVQLLA